MNALGIQTVLFDIKGMTCNGCASYLENDVNKLPGIVSVIRHEAATAKVDFNQIKVSLAQIKEAINHKGYKIRAINKFKYGNQCKFSFHFAKLWLSKKGRNAGRCLPVLL